MQAEAFLMLAPVVSQAATCLSQDRPFVPSDSLATRAYADIMRRDFEIYIKDLQDYFRCLEQRRARSVMTKFGFWNW